MELKKALLHDLPALQEICKKAYTLHFADHWIDNGLELHLEYQYGTKRLKLELEDKEIAYFFIRQNGTNIGFIKMNYRASTKLSLLDNCELEKIYILPKYSGRGIGKMALSTIINSVLERGKKIIYLCVVQWFAR